MDKNVKREILLVRVHMNVIYFMLVGYHVLLIVHWVPFTQYACHYYSPSSTLLPC
jgi:hypothetical protein